MVHDLRVGWSEFVGRTWVWVIVAAFSIMNAIHAGIWFTLGPPIAKRTIGEGAWGVVLSAEAVGFVVMSVILLRVTLRFPVRAGMIGVTAVGLPMLMLGLRPETSPWLPPPLSPGQAPRCSASAGRPPCTSTSRARSCHGCRRTTLLARSSRYRSGSCSRVRWRSGSAPAT